MGLFSPETLLRGFGVEPADIMAQAQAMRNDFDAIRAEVAGLQRDREGLKEAFRAVTARLAAQMERIERKLDDALVMTSMMERIERKLDDALVMTSMMERIERKLDDALVMTSMMECNRTAEGAPAAENAAELPRLRLAAGG